MCNSKRMTVSYFYSSKNFGSWRFFQSEFFIYLISLALSQPFLKLDCSLFGFRWGFRSLANQCSTVVHERGAASPFLPLRYSRRGLLVQVFLNF